jgi:crotonobetainyl-CoA:carnitine CoA-transferase CaiB-like acyl-CoA transferase
LTIFSGLKVLDVASYVAAPAAATILSDFGAEVIKIETPEGGDRNRLLSSLPGMPLSEQNYAWDFTSRNKRGLALDLKRPEGQAVLHRLVEKADVLITNFPINVRAKLGLEYAGLAKLNARLIYASVSGYGEVGPEANRPGFDATAYFARSGLTDLVRPHKDAPPVSTAAAQGDCPTASTLYGAIVTALYQRERTGLGANVSTSLLANGFWANGVMIQAALSGAEMMHRQPRNQPRNPLSNFFLCRDGRWLSMLMISEDKLWPVLLAHLGRAELAQDKRFATGEARRTHSEALTVILDQIFLKLDASQWQAQFQSSGLTVSVVAKLADVPNDAQAYLVGAIVEGEGKGDGRSESRVGTQKTVDSPFQIAGVSKVRPRAAPSLGEHSDSVLTSFGFGAGEISELRRIKVVF